jgi:ABC-type transport system involved in multi-copper enzyme maturation permease subunit
VRSLLRKELNSLRPFLALVLFFALLNWVFLFLAEFPDQYPLSKLISEEARLASQVIICIMALALAAGLLVREQDEGTLAFLDALPVSRTRVFSAKCLLALGVLWLLPLSELIFNTLTHAWSRTSLETRFHWDLLLTAALLDAASCFIYLSVGLALSFLRRFSLLVMGLLVWAYLLLREFQVPFLSLFNPFTLGETVFHGQRWLLPTTQLAVQLGVGLACLSVAFGAFLALGDPAQRLAERVKRSRGATVLGGLATALIVATWLGLLVYAGVKFGDDSEGPSVSYAEWATSRAFSERYQFLYPENQSGLVSALLDQADRVEARVREFLGAQPIPRIVADLTGSGPHTAGQAHWKKVELDLARVGGDWTNVAAVLAHETAHVYLDQVSEGRLSDQFNATRFFHEGVASFVEYHLFRPTNQLAQLRRVAAVARARNEVKIEELLDDDALARRRDPDLVYPLGEVFVAALVQRYGEAALGRVVRSFARTNAPKGLQGLALWQDTLQACGYDLSAVMAGFFAELDRAVAAHRPFVESLPRLRGAVQREAGRLGVRAIYEGKDPGTLVCRFRPRADTPSRLYELVYAEDGKTFWVDRADYAERRYWYQLGWIVAKASQPIYEPWVEAK